MRKGKIWFAENDSVYGAVWVWNARCGEYGWGWAKTWEQAFADLKSHWKNHLH